MHTHNYTQTHARIHTTRAQINIHTHAHTHTHTHTHAHTYMCSADHSRFMHKRKAARRAEEGFRRMDEEDPYGAARRGAPLARELQVCVCV